jgi:hypothetical protein
MMGRSRGDERRAAAGGPYAIVKDLNDRREERRSEAAAGRREERRCEAAAEVAGLRVSI